MLVFGIISPHPPIIIPEIGKGEEKKVSKTIEALEQAALALAATKPDEIIIIAPHEGHGFEVPLYYLGRHLPADVPVERVLVSDPSYKHYYEFGRNVGEAVGKSDKRYAIIASGDLSHVLSPDGPYGYNPAGPVLDKLIVQAVRDHDAQALLGADPNTLTGGAECGLRSILFLLGAAETTGFEPQVQSYEGPFGVGYLVATFAAPAQNEGLHVTQLARDAIEYYLKTGEQLSTPEPLPPSLKRKAGAFVSLHSQDGALRCCIGTTGPTTGSLAEEVISNAVAAATRDPRFAPLAPGELRDLRISVDVLGKQVVVRSTAKLDPAKFGLIVRAADGRSGVLLPQIDGITSVEQQIAICREKADIDPNEAITMRKFTSDRFEEPARAGV